MKILHKPHLELHNMHRVASAHRVRDAVLLTQRTLVLPPADRAPLDRVFHYFQQVTGTQETPNWTHHAFFCHPWQEVYMPSMVSSSSQKKGRVCGILCLATDNISGGIHRFLGKTHPETFFRHLSVGEMVIFDSDHLTHEIITPILVYPHPYQEGYIEYLVMEGCRPTL